MTWTPDYKKDSDRIKKSKVNKIQTWERNEISSSEKPTKIDFEEREETDVSSEKPSQRIKELQTKLHTISQPRGIYRDLFLELSELAITGMTEPGQQRDIGNAMLTKLRKKGFKITQE